MQHLEQDLQMNIVQFLRLQYPNLLFTISPGGLLTNARVGGKAKKLGYNSGVPDLIIFEPRGGYHGIFIELKTEKGFVNELQKKYHDELIAKGYFVCVRRNFDEAIQTIAGYLSQK